MNTTSKCSHISSNTSTSASQHSALTSSRKRKVETEPLERNASPEVADAEHEDACLHCLGMHRDRVQVNCDDCASYICEDCHWCHEFQANHEIRVCDRCDAFYCRKCDEMDQCEDCGEVVCGQCSTLLSCKFCGCGLCEECATACGRCGIVLCSRDAKFAVECDTCRLSYCLVCLASGNKDNCVRCNHRPSKRMEQLVHLRLKSIYKAFKQSSVSKAINSRMRENDEPLDPNQEPEALLKAAAAASTRGLKNEEHISDQEKRERFEAEQEKADAAAAALLEELEEEEKAAESKKSKKKKKKGKKPTALMASASNEDTIETTDTRHDTPTPSSPPSRPTPSQDARSYSPEGWSQASSHKILASPLIPHHAGINENEEEQLQTLLEALIAEEDIDAIEDFLASIKGIPGRASVRKLAKKALKRLRTADDEPEPLSPEAIAPPEEPLSHPDVADDDNQDDDNQDDAPAKSERMLKVVVPTHVRGNKPNPIKPRGPPGAKAFESVLHMAPAMVGWVIGKGGQRIRELMEESGARIWIDQESVGKDEPRIVYVSGQRSSVDVAVRLIQDLIDRAPPDPNQPLHNVPLTKEEEPKKGSDVKVPAEVAPKNGNSSTKHIMTCEGRYVPLLIGKRGWAIKHIQDTSGARVDIDQSVNPKRITISGSEKSVQAAIEMVNDVLSYPNVHPLDENEDDGDKEEYPSVFPDAGEGGRFMTPSADAYPVSPAASPSQKRSVLHGSPPSSLVVSGDAKSTISATSSLSTTPEPTTHAMGKGSYQQALAGPILPPAAVIGVSHSQQSASATPQPSLISSGHALSGLPVASTPGHSLLSSRRSGSEPFLQPNPFATSSLNDPLGHYVQSPPYRQQLSDVFPSHAPPPSRQLSAPAQFGGIYPDLSSNLGGDSLWNPQHSDIGGFPPTQPSPALQTSDPYQSTTGFRLDAAVDFLNRGRNVSSSSPHIELPAASDSEVVDSLFGNPSRPLADDSHLLSGLRHLTMDDRSHQQVDLWGDHQRNTSVLPGLSAPLPPPTGLAGSSLNTPVEASQLFADTNEDSKQHPFTWGASSGF